MMSENWPKSRRTLTNLNHAMKKYKEARNRRLVIYSLLSITIATLFISHQYYEWYNLSNAYIIAIINQIKTYDYGNAIAVLLGVGGYLLENYFQRKTAREEKQMDRVEQQSHKLLVPVTIAWHGLHSSLLFFIDKHIGDILSKDEYKEEVIKYEQKMNILCNNPLFGSSQSFKHPITSACSIDTLFDIYEMKPRVSSKQELPFILHNEILHCKRDSKLWKAYERYIRYSFIPTIERIADIIKENGHLMEPVSPSRMKQMYGADGTGYGQKWSIAPRGWFYSIFLSYVKSWQEVLAMWDEDMKDEIRPNVDFPVGIMNFNVEAQSIVAKTEQELIGMSQMHGHSGKRPSVAQVFDDEGASVYRLKREH